MTREQFIRYVEQEQEQLRRFLLALCCGNREEADDIAQDTLVKAYLSSERYRDEGKFTAWLYKIAHNTFLDRKKAHQYHEELEEAERQPDSTFAADRTFDHQELYAAIATLPVKERTALLLFYLKGYSIKEIAQITGCHALAVRKQLSRGREQLKKRITP